MCPEQFHSAKDVGPAADRWSLAVVLYHALTGRVPFFGPTLPAVILAVEKGEFLLPFATWQLGNEGIDEFFRRALARDPLARFETLRGMVAAWHDALGLEPPEVTGTLDASLIPTRNDLPNGRAYEGQHQEHAAVAASFEPNERPSKGTTPGWTAPSASEERPIDPRAGDEIPGPQPNDNPTVGAIPSKVSRRSGDPVPAARGPRWAALLAVAALIGASAFFLLRGAAVPDTGAAAPPEPAVIAEVPAREVLPPKQEAPPSTSAAPTELPDELEPPLEKTAAQPTPSAPRQPAPTPVAPKAKPASTKRPAPAPAFKDRGF
jgi:serine/threonine-protein kinase